MPQKDTLLCSPFKEPVIYRNIEIQCSSDGFLYINSLGSSSIRFNYINRAVEFIDAVLDMTELEYTNNVAFQTWINSLKSSNSN